MFRDINKNVTLYIVEWVVFDKLRLIMHFLDCIIMNDKFNSTCWQLDSSVGVVVISSKIIYSLFFENRYITNKI